MTNFDDCISWKDRHQWREISGDMYLVNVFHMGQWICQNCKEIVLEDYTYKEDCGCCKPDLVMYQDYVIDNYTSKNNRRKK
jgi:hypothetical protein